MFIPSEAGGLPENPSGLLDSKRTTLVQFENGQEETKNTSSESSSKVAWGFTKLLVLIGLFNVLQVSYPIG